MPMNPALQVNCNPLGRYPPTTQFLDHDDLKEHPNHPHISKTLFILFLPSLQRRLLRRTLFPLVSHIHVSPLPTEPMSLLLLPSPYPLLFIKPTNLLFGVLLWQLSFKLLTLITFGNLHHFLLENMLSDVNGFTKSNIRLMDPLNAIRPV